VMNSLTSRYVDNSSSSQYHASHGHPHSIGPSVRTTDRAVYGWSATPLQWILQYWTPVEWTPVGV
jgi:hypothetical protein